MTFDLNTVKAEIEKIYDEVVAIHREIHMHPEVGEQEAETEKRICKWLDDLEIPYENHIAGHGVCATIYGQNTDHTVAIRADIDALPVQEATSALLMHPKLRALCMLAAMICTLPFS